MNGETLKGQVLRAVNGGYGLLQIDGKTVFARNALKGEEVTVAIRSRRKGVLFGEVTAVEAAHPHRREAPCPVADRCGGCHYQTADPAAQEQAKKEALEELTPPAPTEADEGAAPADGEAATDDEGAVDDEGAAPAP